MSVTVEQGIIIRHLMNPYWWVMLLEELLWQHHHISVVLFLKKYWDFQMVTFLLICV